MPATMAAAARGTCRLPAQRGVRSSATAKLTLGAKGFKGLAAMHVHHAVHAMLGKRMSVDGMALDLGAAKGEDNVAGSRRGHAGAEKLEFLDGEGLFGEDEEAGVGRGRSEASHALPAVEPETCGDLCEDLAGLERAWNVDAAALAGAVAGAGSDAGEGGAHGEQGAPSWWPAAVPWPTNRVRGLLLLNVLAFLFGSNMTVIKDTEALVDPMVFSACRFGLAAVAFSPLLPAAFKDKRIIRCGAELGTWLALGYITQGMGLMSTDASRASFIATFTVIAVPLLAGATGTRIKPATWMAAAMATAGVCLLESGGGSFDPTMGDALSLASAVLFGVHMWRTEHLSEDLPESATLPLIATQLATVAIVSTAAMFLTPGAGAWDAIAGEASNAAHALAVGGVGGLGALLQSDMAGIPIVPFVYCGIVTTATCLWIECVALRDVTSVEAAVIYSCEPIWGAMFAWVLLGERWGPMGWVGAALILSGSLLAQVAGDPKDTAPEEKMAALPAALPAVAAGEDDELRASPEGVN